MSDSETRQEKNIVGGDLAGHDVIKSTYNILNTPTTRSTMATLIEKFKYEKEHDIQFKKTIEKLEHYNRQAEGDEIIGLEAKLRAAEYDAFIEFAEKTKELFTKKLAKHQFSESAQQIYAFLLAEVWDRYYRNVYPCIQQGFPQDQICKIIETQVLDHIKSLLEENVLELYADEISGMLSFLTGNCHVKWTR